MANPDWCTQTPNSESAGTPLCTPRMPANDFFDFNRTDSRRSFLLLALGATLGLAIAGYGLFTSKGTSTNRLPPEDIALVNQKPIYRSDFVIQTQTLYSVPFEQTNPQQYGIPSE